MRNTGDVFERTHQEDREVMSLEMSFVRGIPHTETSLWLTSIFCIKILSFNHKHSQNDFNTLKLQNRSPTYIPNARPQQAQAAPCHPCTTWHRGSPELFALCSFLCMLCSRPMGPQPAPLQWEGCAGLPVPPPARGVGSSVLTGMGGSEWDGMAPPAQGEHGGERGCSTGHGNIRVMGGPQLCCWGR